MKIMFTGFEPFGGESINPAWEAVDRLPDTISGAQIVKIKLPVEFQGAARAVQEALTREKPDAVVCVGQAGGRKSVTVERVAINLDDASMSDNAGITPHDAPIRRGAPAAYFATLPVKDIVAAMKNAGVAADISNTAGTYVCNHLMYAVLDYFSIRMLNSKAGFVHVPYIPQQCVDKPDAPSMELEDIVKALAAAADVLAALPVRR